MIFEDYTLMDCVAIWGAITGSIATILSIGNTYVEIRRYIKEKAILKIHVHQASQSYSKVNFIIANNGKNTTTLVDVFFRTYPSFISYLRRKDYSELSPWSLEMWRQPYKLEPGALYRENDIFTPEIYSKWVEMKNSGKIFTVEILHSGNLNKPFSTRM
jgi:hypothetical protein